MKPAAGLGASEALQEEEGDKPRGRFIVHPSSITVFVVEAVGAEMKRAVEQLSARQKTQ